MIDAKGAFMSNAEEGEGEPIIDPALRNVDERVRLAALDLLRADRHLDDSIFTPLGAMSLCIDPLPETPEADS